jgi:hypothetical protein
MRTFAGFRIIVERPRWCRRTWRERLFSWPWRPRQGMKQVGPRLGATECYCIGDTLVMGEAGL